MVDATIDMPKSTPSPTAFIAPSAQDLDKLFEHLEIQSLLGQGGMGAVYKARQISLDRFVAVKILPPYSGNDPSFQERFQREARALAKLTHPNIVMVFEFGQVSEMFYFVMEYVDGVNLREAIEAGGLTTHESLKVVPQICEALQYAHDEGIVHRDIKPENIILDSKGRIKIADFGLAKLMENNAINFTLTSTNQVLGTVKYMAPEQIESPNQVDHRSDIYSLGVVFYELLTGELPLGRFDPPSFSVPSNGPLDPVVMRTLEKQPANRFQNASEVKTAVESVKINESVQPAKVADKDIPDKAKSFAGATANRSASKRLPAVNFQLQKVFAGFGRGKGLLRVDYDAEELILDIEIKDFLGGLFRSEFKQVRIGFEHILSFNTEFSWYSTPSLEIQTDYFQEFATLPGAENGKLDLTFLAKDKKNALAFCEQVSHQLGFGSNEERDDAQVAEEPVDLKSIQESLVKPARGLRIAGFIDLLASVILLIVSVAVAIFGGRDIEISPIACAVGVLFACFGIFQFFLSQSVKSVYGYWTLLIGSLSVSVLWFHPGALFSIPSTVWLLILMTQKRYRNAFRQSKNEQTESPSHRSIVYTDAQTQMELRAKISRPTWVLFFSGLISLFVVVSIGIAFTDMSPTKMAQSGRMPVLLFSVSAFGVLAFLGSLILRFIPSIFWVAAISKMCKLPTHWLFPVNLWIGKRLEAGLARYENENFSRNPYVEKDEV